MARAARYELGGVGTNGGPGSTLGVAAFVMGFLTFGMVLINIPGIAMTALVGALVILAIALPKTAGGDAPLVRLHDRPDGNHPGSLAGGRPRSAGVLHLQ